MKVLFIIQGEGRGHLTQALSFRQKMEEEGYEVVGVLVGKSSSRQLPAFFLERIQVPVYTFESPNFLPSAQNKRVCVCTSVLYSILHLYKYVKSILYINRMIHATDAEVVVNFYELLTGLTYLFCRPKAVMVCIAHQYLFLHPDFEFPRLNPLSLASLKFFTRLTAIGATKKLALSFRKMREVPSEKMIVVPPLLRKEVLELEPEKGDYFHGYLLNSGFAEEVKEWHTQYPHIPLHFFWDKKGAGKVTRIDENLSFYLLDDRLFLHYMSGAKAYATTAGFESVCEAFYLEKPVLLVPIHIEQACNAHDASRTGTCVTSTRFDLGKLFRLAETHRPESKFRYWVKQADWLILREFRPDLLLEEAPAGFWRRWATHLIYRLGKTLPF